MKYRPYRHSFEESVKLMSEFYSMGELVQKINEDFKCWGIEISHEALNISKYFGEDDRIGWKDVHIISCDGVGVVGFCDGDARRVQSYKNLTDIEKVISALEFIGICANCNKKTYSEDAHLYDRDLKMIETMIRRCKQIMKEK